MKKSTLKIGNLIYIAAVLILTAGFLLFTLEKTQVTNLYEKPTEGEPPISEINQVDYSPANPTDNDEIETKKNTGSIDISDQKDPEPGEPISVVLTAATQDTIGGPVVVRVLLPDVKKGICNITIVKGSVEKSYTKQVVNAGTYYNCDALDIPITDLSEGTWNIKVDVTNDDRSGSATQELEVKI